MLAHVLVLEVSTHRNLPLKATIADWTVIGKGLGVSGEVLGQVILAEESLLTHPTFVRLDSGVSLLVPAHVGAIRKFHL